METDFRGAQVHRETCWDIPIRETTPPEPTKLGDEMLSYLLTQRLVSEDAGILGHVCTDAEIGRSQTGPVPPRILVDSQQPYLRTES